MIITTKNIKQLALAGELYADTPFADKKANYRMLTQPVTYELSNGQLLHVQRGFIWDENSVPWLLQPLFPKSGIYAPAAIPHDALYYLTQTSKEFADAEFAIWMIALGIHRNQVHWRWLAVDLFGSKWWNKNLNNPSPRCLYNRSLITLK